MTEEEYVVFIQPYEDALKNIRVRVEVLNDDYRRKYQNYPIHHVQDRVKKKESIEQKLIRRGYESDVESARDCLTDISGIRVICYFVRDIYAVVSLLKKQTDIVVIKECDYISNPKPYNDTVKGNPESKHSDAVRQMLYGNTQIHKTQIRSRNCFHKENLLPK